MKNCDTFAVSFDADVLRPSRCWREHSNLHFAIESDFESQCIPILDKEFLLLPQVRLMVQLWRKQRSYGLSIPPAT